MIDRRTFLASTCALALDRRAVAGPGAPDDRYRAIVEGMLDAKLRRLRPNLAHGPDHPVVAFFHLEADGRIRTKDIVVKSGQPAFDQLALRAVEEAAPFPPPPSPHVQSLYWSATGDSPRASGAMRELGEPRKSK